MICAEEKWAENTHESVAATQNFEIAIQSGYICSAITGLLPLEFQLPLILFINQKVFFELSEFIMLAAVLCDCHSLFGVIYQLPL